jgi:hypothetical protein
MAYEPTNQIKGREGDLQDRALAAFHTATGLRILVDQIEVIRHQHDYARRVDAIGHIDIDGTDEIVVIETKTRLTNPMLGAVAHQLQQLKQHHEHEHGLLVTDYVNPVMAERLKELGVFFIDTVGNAYLNLPPVLVYIRGNKPEKKASTANKTRAFQPTGLKVLFAFMCNPELVNAPYRDIANAANVALGTVGWVINDLKELGYIAELGKGHRVIRGREKLLDRWVVTYPEQLRPKLLLGRYTVRDKTWWKKATLTDYHAYWGGEVAAAKLTQYLKPELVTIYVREQTARLQLEFGMNKDPNGEIELLNAFWNRQCDLDDKDITPTLLTYADLLTIGEQRNIDTVTIIYDQYLAQFIAEDR